VLLPLGLVEGGALLSSAIGAALLVIAHGLLRRVEGAWWVAVGALAAEIVASLAHGLDYERASILLLMILILLPCKREFYRSARLTRNPPVTALGPAVGIDHHRWYQRLFLCIQGHSIQQ